MCKRGIAVWLKGTRANFLVLSVFLVMIGGAAAWHEGVFDLSLFLWTVAGVVIAHASVNLFNEYSDWRTGVDTHTERTPFSGGSGNLQTGLVAPRQVKLAAWGTLFVAFLIGLGLAYASGWPVLVFMVFGGLTIVGYTDFFTRFMLGEVLSGITLGSLVVIGAYYVQQPEITAPVVWVAVPPGLLTMLLLFLNEFPDADADKLGGRHHLVIALGKKKAAILYSTLLVFTYVWIAAGVGFNITPAATLLGLLTLPIGIGAIRGAIRFHDDAKGIVPAMGMNVIVVLVTDLLLAMGFMIG